MSADAGSDVADPLLAGAGRARIAWAERAMPVLAGIAARYAADRPFAGVRVAACLHVTAETAVFLRALTAGGASVRLCASNPLATQDDTAAALAFDGVAVFARHGAGPADYARHVAAALDSGPQLVLDDGCDLVAALHRGRPDLLAGVRGGCEETSTGVRWLRRLAAEGTLRFPMVAVTETDTLRVVDGYGTAQSTVDALLRATNLLLAGRTVVVAGYGSCGRAVASRFRALGAAVVVTEVQPTRALEAALEGYRVLPMAEAARLGEVILTVTGSPGVLRAEHFAVLRDGAILGNAGHFDVEIDVPALAGLAVAEPEAVRPHLEEYRMADGRRLYLLSRGRLVNLAAAEGHPAGVMDVAFAGQALTAEWLLGAADTLVPGVHPVPPQVDGEVARLALAALDLVVDSGTDPAGAEAGTVGSGADPAA